MVETGAAALVGKQCAKKSTQHFACQPRIPRTAVAQGIWQGEDPLAHRDLGDHAVHEMSGGARHASSAAGRTDGPPFARKSEQAITTAGVAVQAKKAVCEHAACEVRA